MDNSVVIDSAVEEKIQQMVQRIVERFQPDKVILFGSHARGTAGQDSDVDLLVIKPVQGSKRRERVAIGLALQGMGVAKDILVSTPKELEQFGRISGTVLCSALREGKVLYERKAP